MPLNGDTIAWAHCGSIEDGSHQTMEKIGSEFHLEDKVEFETGKGGGGGNRYPKGTEFYVSERRERGAQVRPPPTRGGGFVGFGFIQKFLASFPSAGTSSISNYSVANTAYGCLQFYFIFFFYFLIFFGPPGGGGVCVCVCVCV